MKAGRMGNENSRFLCLFIRCDGPKFKLSCPCNHMSVSDDNKHSYQNKSSVRSNDRLNFTLSSVKLAAFNQLHVLKERAFNISFKM